MSKKLILLRHAKSSWDANVNTDFERPLNDRGKMDAPRMAEFFSQQSIPIDLIYSSSAVRAVTTAKVFRSQLGVSEARFIEDERVYRAGVNQLQALLRELHDDWNSVMVVGHNPTMTDCANALCDDEVENIPTCGIYAMELDIDSWRKSMNGVGRKLFFQRPKSL